MTSSFARPLRNIDLHGHPPRLLVVIDGESYHLNPRDDEGQLAGLRDRQATSDAIVYDISELLRYDEVTILQVLQFVAATEQPYSVRSQTNAEPGGLFDAVLELIGGHDDPDECEHGRRTAVTTAAILYPSAIQIACSRIEDRLRELSVRGPRSRYDDLVREAMNVVRRLRTDRNEDNVQFFLEILADAPVPSNCVVPPGWTITQTGIELIDTEAVRIPAPVVIMTRLVDVADSTEKLRIAHRRDGRWAEHIVDRAVLASAREIISLADYGFPVTSNNSKVLVQYLADFEAHNIEILRCERMTSRNGSQTIPTPADGRPPQIAFRGADDGEDQLAAAYGTQGTFEGWHQTVAPLVEFPAVQLAIVASLSAPMLAITGAPNFAVSYAGITSQGKTTTLRIAGSCWGCPDERSVSTVVGTWDATRVWLERAAAVNCDLPLIVDDTKRARRELVRDAIYDLANGRGRGRGSVDGIRRSTAYRTITITSGEESLLAFSNDGGARTRVLEYWGSPFGGANLQTGRLVNDLNEAVCEHYGHAGPHLVGVLATSGNDYREGIRQRYAEWRRYFTELGDGITGSGRLAHYVAILQVTAEVAHALGILPWDAQGVVPSLYPLLTSHLQDADRSVAGLRHVYGWAISQPGRFSQGGGGGGEIAGRWETGVYLGFVPAVVASVLHDGGFDAQAVLRTWLDRGWLLVSPRRRWYRARLGRHYADLVAIDLTHVDVRAIVGEEEGEGAQGERPSGPSGTGLEQPNLPLR